MKVKCLFHVHCTIFCVSTIYFWWAISENCCLINRLASNQHIKYQHIKLKLVRNFVNLHWVERTRYWFQLACTICDPAHVPLIHSTPICMSNHHPELENASALFVIKKWRNFSPKPPQKFDSHMQCVLACGIKGESLSANQKLLQVFHLQTFQDWCVDWCQWVMTRKSQQPLLCHKSLDIERSSIGISTKRFQ